MHKFWFWYHTTMLDFSRSITGVMHHHARAEYHESKIRAKQ